MAEVPPTLLVWGAGLGLSLLGVSAFVLWHGPGRRLRGRRASNLRPLPRRAATAPGELRGMFAALSDRPDRELDQALRLWAAMAAATGCRVVVEASADASGNPAVNRRLVAGRARSAVVRLHEAGVPNDRIRVVHRSPAPAADEEGRRKLRWVTLRAQD